ncbi:MAG TPA: hypothetical protein VKY57_17685, partial [Chitinispirillaceae bacterium]|nr:hypothetical protein [Chitinispirillaceae bacterium]
YTFKTYKSRIRSDALSYLVGAILHPIFGKSAPDRYCFYEYLHKKLLDNLRLRDTYTNVEKNQVDMTVTV